MVQVHLSGLSHRYQACSHLGIRVRDAIDDSPESVSTKPLRENFQEDRMTDGIGLTKQASGSQPAICATAVADIEDYNLPLLMMHGIHNPVVSYPGPVEVLCSA